MKNVFRYLPLLAMALAGCREKMVETKTEVDMRPHVKTVQAVTRPFVDGLRVQGTVRAKNSVMVSARVPGTIDEILVEEGASLTNGAALFRVDRVNLENAVNQARAARTSAVAAIGEAEAALEKAKWDNERMERLFSGKAVTKDAYEKARLQYRSVTAKLDAARAGLAQSEAAVKSAEKNLADSVVRAPITGIVTRKLKEAGDYVSPGMPVFSMDGTEVYELSISLAAEHYAKVVVGKTKVIGEETWPVGYKSPSVDPRTRTFEIRCVLNVAESSAKPVPGMIRNVRVVFDSFEAKAVPEAAVGTRGGRQVVFVVRDGRIAAVPVKTGTHADGWTEVREPDLGREAIVAEGMLLLNEGEEVRRVSE